MGRKGGIWLYLRVLPLVLLACNSESRQLVARTLEQLLFSSSCSVCGIQTHSPGPTLTHSAVSLPSLPSLAWPTVMALISGLVWLGMAFVQPPRLASRRVVVCQSRAPPYTDCS
ncbi:MAG: hypothetical protein IVW51_10975 [Thermaceae bacterium]|nr:hypothetical protein [Thermaceae bacterium]